MGANASWREEEEGEEDETPGMRWYPTEGMTEDVDGRLGDERGDLGEEDEAARWWEAARPRALLGDW